MTEKAMIWFGIASGVALAITYDMRRLAVNRVGLTLTGWLFVSACTGPFAIVAYLICRRTVWLELIHAVCEITGDSTRSVQARRKRLVALRESGMIGAPVFRHALAALEAGSTQSSK